jgi:hypothetical protein
MAVHMYWWSYKLQNTFVDKSPYYEVQGKQWFWARRGLPHVNCESGANFTNCTLLSVHKRIYSARFYSETIRNLRKRETNCYRLSLKLIVDREHGLRVYKSAFCSKGRHGNRVIFSALTVSLDVSLFVSELLNLVSSVTSLFPDSYLLVVLINSFVIFPSSFRALKDNVSLDRSVVSPYVEFDLTFCL